MWTVLGAGVVPFVAVLLWAALDSDAPGGVFIAAVIWLVITLIVAIALYPNVVRVPTLTIDEAGVEVTAGGSSTRLAWSDLERVSIVERGVGNRRTRPLVGWLRQGVAVPKARAFHPKPATELGGALEIFDLSLLAADPAEVERTVVRCAGPVWQATPAS